LIVLIGPSRTPLPLTLRVFMFCRKKRNLVRLEQKGKEAVGFLSSLWETIGSCRLAQPTASFHLF
jgi:hypothetical protein